jgi:hypothetical protein
MPPSARTRAALTLARYKRLILMGKVSLPLEEARRIVGPDCAYHLYFRHAGERPSEGDRGRRRKRTRIPAGSRRGQKKPRHAR